ncbi:transcription factor TFIIB [Nitrosopumilus sp. K4]|uniref:transcription initiation factor IIB n=1 Tax=Nitrosopumilus sp. K4 TaxID=2795383 RepID=UPI001BAC0E08|nr:transcription factor TFIIB [Nitrosopumilus sp. K4]QUC63987.1 transcription factor TFIIB [Nitrosopumilus sp. K4]
MLSELIHQNNCKKIRIVTDFDTGEIACQNCGAVSPEKAVALGPENTGLTKEEYLTSFRAGRKISLKMADMGLPTIIESKDKDATGKSLSRENRKMFYRLRIWDRNSRSANTVKSLQKAFLLLDGIKTKLAIPESVVEQTAYIFRKISAKKILSGRSTSSILCATVYIACRLTNTPRTLQDIANAGNIRRKNLQKTYRFLVKELEIYPEAYNPHEFVSRISKAIKISEKTERLAFRIVTLAEKEGISTSKNPMAIAAAAVHVAAQKNKEKASQVKISQTSGISAVTIRDRTKEIKKRIWSEI